MTPLYRAGFWCDVYARPDGRLGHVTVEGARVRCFEEQEAAPLWVQDAPEVLGFCRCAVYEGIVLSIHQGQSGRAWIVRQGEYNDLGLTFGAQPVAIDATYAYVVRSPHSYDRIRLSDGRIESLAHGVPGSSQGISDISPGGTIWWADTHRTMVVAGVTLTYPNRRGSVIVGQSDPPQIAGVATASPFTAFVGDSFEPHIAQSGDRYAICARTSRGAAYLVGPPFPPYVTAPAPPPAPVPVPPKPEPPPMPEPQNHLALVDEIRRKYGYKVVWPDKTEHWTPPLGENHWKLLVELAQRTGGKLFRKDGGTNVFVPALGFSVSADIIILDGWWIDVLGDAENEAVPAWNPNPNAGEPEKWIDVSRIVLPGAPPPSQPPSQPPAQPPAPQPPPVDLEPLRKQIAELRGLVEALRGDVDQDAIRDEQRFTALERRQYRVVGQTSRSLGHAHGIDVRLEPLP